MKAKKIKEVIQHLYVVNKLPEDVREKDMVCRVTQGRRIFHNKQTSFTKSNMNFTLHRYLKTYGMSPNTGVKNEQLEND